MKVQVPDIPGPTATLCWRQGPLMDRCDREKGHGGRCVWDIAAELAEMHKNHPEAGCYDALPKLQAELAEARERIYADNAVCICGCPADEHEICDEEGGESCANEAHTCIRVCAAAAAEFAAVRARLPASMQDCTILFRECAQGHGWLTAANWVQHECPTCASAQLKALLDATVANANHDYEERTEELTVARAEVELALRAGYNMRRDGVPTEDAAVSRYQAMTTGDKT